MSLYSFLILYLPVYINKCLSEPLLLYDFCVHHIYSPYIQVYKGPGKGKEINKQNNSAGSLINQGRQIPE